MSDCVGYTPKILDYFIPFNTLDTVCFSYDKTEMFIVSAVRVAIYIVLLYVVYNPSTGVPDELYKKIIYYIALLFIVINLLVLLSIMIKIPKYSKKQLNNYPKTSPNIIKLTQ
jgi:hypothetical protein